MIIGIPRESLAGETRVAATPQTVGQLLKLGYSVVVESGAGAASSFADAAYVEAGAEIGDAEQALSADVVLKVNAPRNDEVDEIAALRDGATLVSLISPALNPELVEKLSARPITVLAMDAVPRISRAQSLDVLSSMANIAGYRAVVEAAHSFGRFFTGQVTAAGKVPPAKVLVVGAGVAGLAAIGAAGSLGAIVKATDPRPEVADQVRSLGGEYVSVDPAANEVSATGYAKEMGDDYKARESALYAELASDVDIIITTALIPGRPAPRIITAEMVASMKPGSVLVDMAASNGGNVEGTVKDQAIVTDHGVTIIGYTDLASRLAEQSSTLYSNNLLRLAEELCKTKDGVIDVNFDDDAIRGLTVIKEGAVTWPPPPPKLSAPPAPKAAAAPVPAQKKGHGGGGEPMAAGTLAMMFAGAAILFLLIGAYAPPAFLGHFTVFVLACFVGYMVVWNVTPALHTPLMSVTNAISSIIIIGALVQIAPPVAASAAGEGARPDELIRWIAIAGIALTAINMFGGFAVTQRMLAMFRK